ncbi:glycosyltransferase family 4 protein [Changpingibacter yushuensis]|uniref:glycosyltransferase family 4 protein n=1 Tax=Changpingibacter yushuensis TaxID=2758440 RepID=UPI00165DDA17|nr:glycosyltransferase [Changpingibacter yushuensis]
MDVIDKTILMVGFSCLPGAGSEPGVGWNWCIEAAKRSNVVFVTRSKHRDILESAVPPELRDRLTFLYCDSSSALRKISIYFEYLDWQRRAFQTCRDYIECHQVDAVWHITWGTMIFPAKVLRLSVPTIWGPVGGGDLVPWEFLKQMPFRTRIVLTAKNLIIRSVPHMRYFRRQVRSATLVIARTSETEGMLGPLVGGKSEVRLETAFDSDSKVLSKQVSALATGSNPRVAELTSSVEVCCTNRLTSRKNVLFLIQAFAMAINMIPGLHLTIIGSGPEMGRIRSEVTRLNIEEYVSLVGELPNEEVLECVAASDIFAFPSLTEGGSWSLMEAMALGKPIVCLDQSGMHEICTEDCAQLVEVTTYSRTLQEYAEAIVELATNIELRAQKGAEASNVIRTQHNRASQGEYIYDVLLRATRGQDQGCS